LSSNTNPWEEETAVHRGWPFGESLQGTLAEQIQLELAHRSFQAQQPPVVDNAGIVDAVRIDDYGSHHPAKFYQMMPITPVPR
jgi:hypothetical protein